MKWDSCTRYHTHTPLPALLLLYPTFASLTRQDTAIYLMTTFCDRQTPFAPRRTSVGRPLCAVSDGGWRLYLALYRRGRAASSPRSSIRVISVICHAARTAVRWSLRLVAPTYVPSPSSPWTTRLLFSPLRCRSPTRAHWPHYRTLRARLHVTLPLFTARTCAHHTHPHARTRGITTHHHTHTPRSRGRWIWFWTRRTRAALTLHLALHTLHARFTTPAAPLAYYRFTRTHTCTAAFYTTSALRTTHTPTLHTACTYRTTPLLHHCAPATRHHPLPTAARLPNRFLLHCYC